MTLHQKHTARLFLIIIAIVFYFLANIQRVAIPGAMFNLLQGDFLASASKITLLGAIFSYVYAFSQLVVGILVDKIGGFRVIALGSVIFALGSFIFPSSDNLIGLYISRALVGFGASTFYISTVREVKKYSKDKNFSLAISYILFIGYSGGIIANAPFVALIQQFGWHNVLYNISYFTILLAVIFVVSLVFFKPTHIEKEIKFSFSPYLEVLKNPKNINLFIFGCINYGLYYVLQSIIGNKFLQDFCLISVHKSAIILSGMALISAFAGTITAFISKCLNNRRAIIFKTFAFLSMFSTLSVCLFLIFDIRSYIVALILCIPAFIGSISPLLIFTLHLYNRYEITATAVSIQNCLFFLMVGFLGTISGILMNIIKPIEQNGIMIYSNTSYLLVFGLFFSLSLIEVFCALRIKD